VHSFFCFHANVLQNFKCKVAMRFGEGMELYSRFGKHKCTTSTTANCLLTLKSLVAENLELLHNMDLHELANHNGLPIRPTPRNAEGEYFMLTLPKL